MCSSDLPGDPFWAILCKEMGREELIEEERFLHNYHRSQNNDECITIINAWTQQFTKAELAEKLGGRIPFGPVQDAAEVFADPHVTARDMLVAVEHPRADKPYHIPNTPIKMTSTDSGVYRRAPLLGEHTDLVLGRYGFSADEIRALHDQSVIE